MVDSSDKGYVVVAAGAGAGAAAALVPDRSDSKKKEAFDTVACNAHLLECIELHIGAVLHPIAETTDILTPELISALGLQMVDQKENFPFQQGMKTARLKQLE